MSADIKLGADSRTGNIGRFEIRNSEESKVVPPKRPTFLTGNKTDAALFAAAFSRRNFPNNFPFRK